MIICYLHLIAINYLFRLYLCDDHLSVERRTHRNALEDVGTPEYPDDADIRQDHGGESEPRHGETLATHRADGELHLSGYII